MGVIRLTGTLSCATPEDAALVGRLLPDHLHLTHAEPGRLSFIVRPMDDGLTWIVDETFVDRAAFQAHQARTLASDWGRATAHIPRSYQITEG